MRLPFLNVVDQHVFWHRDRDVLERARSSWRAVAVTAGTGKTLAVRFVDGTAGRVELSRFLAARCVDGTLFEALREDLFFGQAAVADGVIRWPNGADLAPDAMYDAIRESGCWLP
jgi:hypothetical protein